MNVKDYIIKISPKLISQENISIKNPAFAFAHVNIALIKYWGKRDKKLNLPFTNSLSISLGNKGSSVYIDINCNPYDIIWVNNNYLFPENSIYKKIINFINLFRPNNIYYIIKTYSNVPIAAGLASSASFFASIVKAFNILHNWDLSITQLSLLARLGSGSACRSFYRGFVEWKSGYFNNKMDSFGEYIPVIWEELCIGIIIVNSKKKYISSRDAMNLSILNISRYNAWIVRVNYNLLDLKYAIYTKNFALLGEIVENNSVNFHKLLNFTKPSINYSSKESKMIKYTIKFIRSHGIKVYFTQDAGANIKILFLKEDINIIKLYFHNIEIIRPFID
jgi:diphosphomevalonate decarboxylase